jgi:hypothetical protein
MDPIQFISKRFETPIQGELHIGDEVITKDYGERGIIIRDTYYLGHDREPFTTIFRGQTMSTERVNNLEKTGRHFDEMNTILNALREK